MLKPHIYKTPFIVGLPVPPKQFFGRREQLEQFYGQCILGPVLQPTRILGLKRSGKTSFLNYISDFDVKNGFLEKTAFAATKFAYINADPIHLRAEFYDTVANAISEQLTFPSQNSPELKTYKAFKKWLENTLRANADLKIVVLIDEFEKLHDTEEFDTEFFGSLRALAIAHRFSFTWVTASAVDLYTLDKSQKTSPFWNIFHPTPIVMGGFGEQDAQSLIRDSLKSIGKSITNRETNEILALSGNIPYFIQAVADTWHNLKEKQITPLGRMQNVILDMLSNPTNQIQHVYKNYWDEMDENRRNILKNIASERRNLSASYSDLTTLSEFGLIMSDTGKYGGYRISGQLLKQFIVDVNEDKPVLANGPKAVENATSSTAVNIDARVGTFIKGDVNTDGGHVKGYDNSTAGVNSEQLFEYLYAAIDSKTNLTTDDKADIKHDVEELHQELSKKEQANEIFLVRRLRNIGRMAPEILEVTLATITNPVAGFGVVAKKIADKIKESSNKG